MPFRRHKKLLDDEVIKAARKLKISDVYRDLVVELINAGDAHLIECKDYHHRVFVIWYQIYSNKRIRDALKHPVIARELKSL